MQLKEEVKNQLQGFCRYVWPLPFTWLVGFQFDIDFWGRFLV